jgi:hypothetical protein
MYYCFGRLCSLTAEFGVLIAVTMTTPSSECHVVQEKSTEVLEAVLSSKTSVDFFITLHELCVITTVNT